MKKILVTGGAGYIGSVLVHELVEKGYDVVVLDKGYFGFESLKNVENKITLVKQNFVDYEFYEDFDCVCHLAGFSNDPQADFSPEGNSRVNRDEAIQFFNNCADKQIEKFIFASSAAVYGFDDKNGELTEDYIPNPKSFYAESKLQAEQGMWSRKDEISLIILRQGTVMGCSPRQRYDLAVNAMIKDAVSKNMVTVFGGGEVWRPFINVIDVASAYINIIENDNVESDIFNLVFQNYRISELAHWIVHCIGSVYSDYQGQIQINVDYETKKDKRSYMISGDKIRNKLGFVPNIGILETVRVFLENFKRENDIDFDNPIYYNIDWIKLATKISKMLKENPNVFSEFA